MDRRLVVVADDLTGANDTAVQFRALGPAVTVLSPERLGEFGAFPVVAVTTESRNLPLAEAGARLGATAVRLRELGGPAPRLYKKLDSSLRGWPGAEIDALLDRLGLEYALVAPAYPAQGRITAGGFHLLGQVPVGESDARRDPLTPVTESHLGRLLAGQSRHQVDLLELDRVMAGVAAIRERLRELVTSGVRLIAADATTAAHLDCLAEAVAADPGALLCGSAGLAQAWAGRLAGKPGSDAVADEPTGAGPAGGVLALCGSQTQAARQQVELVRREGAASVWTLEELERGGAGQAWGELAGGRNVLVWVSSPVAGDRAPVRPWAEAPRILESLGAVGRRLAPQARRLVLTGGDTAMAVAKALGAAALALDGEVLPGIVAGRWLGLDGENGPAAALAHQQVVTKSGSFGEPEVLAQLLSL